MEFVIENPAARLAVPRLGKKVTVVHLTPAQIPIVLFNLSDRGRLIVRMFLVLGLAKQSANRQQHHGWYRGRNQAEGSNTSVWPPVTIDAQLEWWRSVSEDATDDGFIFQSTRGIAIYTNNFLFRVLRGGGKKAGVPGVTHQMLRRTCSTYMAQLTTVEDVQAHLRHTNAETTLENYIKSVLESVESVESVRVAVESLDHLLKSKPGEGEPA